MLAPHLGNAGSITENVSVVQTFVVILFEERK